MLQNTRIFVRLIALIAVLLAFMLAIAVDGITAMSGMRDSIKTLYEERAVPLVQIAEILDLLNDDRTDVHAVATVSDPAKLAEIDGKSPPPTRISMRDGRPISAVPSRRKRRSWRTSLKRRKATIGPSPAK